MLRLNRKERRSVSAHWKTIDSKGFACELDRERTGLADVAVLSFVSKSGTHRFSVAISRDDASWLSDHLIRQGAGKIVVAA